jgi:class 3 adenylate cyclase/tetratricopeptide (TPR) repeat protein
MEGGALQRWLERCGLAHLAQTFADNAIDLDVLADLSENDLKELGLSLGDRKRLQRAIAARSREAEEPLAAGEEAAPTRRAVEAERRHMTVLFCDLVGSTELAARLDPEDLAVVIGAYHACCAEVVGRWDGHVARLLGDGVLVYFGYPKAHEDDAERAVRAGLDLIAAVGRLPTLDATPLRARVGIATGLVMVGELLGTGAAQEETVVGETPNLAARLQTLARPDTVVIAARTRHLLGGLFELSDLGEHHLKGFAGPIRAWAVVGEGKAESRFEALHGTMLTPLVGREHELGILLERWSWASDGDGQVVLLAGEPGIGKSRMVRALRERLPDATYVLSHYGSPYHQNSALHPVITCLQRVAKLDPGESPEQQLDKLAALLSRTGDPAEVVPLVASLLSLPHELRYPALTLSPQRQKQRLCEVLVEQMEALTRERPLLAIFEDAQWIDPSTLEFLDLVIERAPRLCLLVVVTSRPGFAPAWITEAHATLLPLNRLGRRQGAAMVERVSGSRTLPPEIRDEIVARTDGVPLFLEELTKTVLESGLLADAQTHPLPPLAIPATLHDSLMARLDRLAPVKEVAQIGAAIGREFGYPLLAAVAPLPEPDLQQALQQLIDAELVFRRGTPPQATYSFKHALVQEAAYGSLLRSRRQQLHARIAALLQQQHGEVEPELLAHHYTHAGFAERAVDYWQQAGQRAAARSAMAEAAGHLSRGLEVLASLPEGPARRSKELDLQTALGRALIAAKGYAADETGQAFARARALSAEMEDGPQLFPVLFGQSLFRLLRGELDIAREVAQEMLGLAERQQDSASLVVAHRALGTNLFWLGQPAIARGHIDQALTLFDPAEHAQLAERYTFHPRVVGLDFRALILLILGYPDEARATSRQALDEARAAAHLVTLAVVLQHACIVHQTCGDHPAMQQAAEELLAIATEQGFPFWVAHGTFLRDWARAAQGRSGRAIPLRDDLEAILKRGAALILPYYYALVAQTFARHDEPAAAQMLDESLALLARTGERWFEAEVHRLRGELQLATARHGGSGDPSGAQACFERAIAVARSQEARLWELRASISLARLWQDQGRLAEARDLLAPIHAWFSEGLELRELVDARTLLDSLA